jgi:hypothetical protein
MASLLAPLAHTLPLTVHYTCTLPTFYAPLHYLLQSGFERGGRIASYGWWEILRLTSDVGTEHFLSFSTSPHRADKFYSTQRQF